MGQSKVQGLSPALPCPEPGLAQSQTGGVCARLCKAHPQARTLEAPWTLIFCGSVGSSLSYPCTSRAVVRGRGWLGKASVMLRAALP